MQPLEEPLDHRVYRELKILARLAQGATRPDVSQEFFLSKNSINTYLDRYRERIGARDVLHAVSISLHYGYLIVSDRIIDVAPEYLTAPVD